MGLAPEAVGDAGRDHEDVVRFGGLGAVSQLDADVAPREVEPGQLTMDGANVREAPVAVEADAIVTGPLLRTRDAHAELLAADQLGLGGDADDFQPFRLLGQADGGEQPAVAEPGNDNLPPGHVAAFVNVGEGAMLPAVDPLWRLFLSCPLPAADLASWVIRHRTGMGSMVHASSA